MKKFILVSLLLFIAFPAIAIIGSGSKEVLDVRVNNFPETQSIDGSVAVKGLIKHSLLNRAEKFIVPPVQREETANLIRAGKVQADGFTSIVLSLHGEVQSGKFTAGTVGAILIPAEGPILSAFRDDRVLLFPLEVKTEVTPEQNSYFNSRHFSSKSAEHLIGFPEYYVYLYNSTNKSVEVNLYMYLTN